MSSTKKVISPFKILDNVALSGSFTSSTTNIQYLDHVAYQLAVSIPSGTNTGTFTVEVSIDGTTWDTLTLDPVIAPLTSVSTTISVNMINLVFPLIRLRFTAGSGTDGHVTAYLTAKEA